MLTLGVTMGPNPRFIIVSPEKIKWKKEKSKTEVFVLFSFSCRGTRCWSIKSPLWEYNVNRMGKKDLFSRV